jgi:hypothetical protein
MHSTQLPAVSLVQQQAELAAWHVNDQSRPGYESTPGLAAVTNCTQHATAHLVSPSRNAGLSQLILRPTYDVSGHLWWIVTVLVHSYRPPRLSYRHKRASLNPARLPELILWPTYDAT